MIIVSAVQPKPCASSIGTYINSLSIKNKQDYARLQGYSVYIGTNLVDPTLGGPWNKMALLKRLMETTDYEWLMWIDADAMFIDVTFKFPFEKYKGKDLVIWGSEKDIFDVPDPWKGTNSGIFAVRNTQWARKFVDDICKLGAKDQEEVMRKGLVNYEHALFDQNAFVYVMHEYGREASMQKVALEVNYAINGWWKHHPHEKFNESRPYICHYAGCQYCSGANPNEAEACNTAWMKGYEFANSLMWNATQATQLLLS